MEIDPPSELGAEESPANNLIFPPSPDEPTPTLSVIIPPDPFEAVPVESEMFPEPGYAVESPLPITRLPEEPLLPAAAVVTLTSPLDVAELAPEFSSTFPPPSE
jgi:hypothetical protein